MNSHEEAKEQFRQGMDELERAFKAGAYEADSLIDRAFELYKRVSGWDFTRGMYRRGQRFVQKIDAQRVSPGVRVSKRT